MKEDDLAAAVRIDRKLTGRDRSAYYAAKLREMLTESGIRVSLVAEEDGFVVGFVMARVDFGEFGKVDKAAVLDTIGVHPGFAVRRRARPALPALPEPRDPPGRNRAHAGVPEISTCNASCTPAASTLSQRLMLSKTIP